MADVSDNRIILRYDAEGPIALERLTDGFNGLARRYRRVVRAQGLKPGDTDARLFLTRIQSGSVEAELAIAAAALGQALTLMDGSLVLHDFTTRIKRSLDYFKGTSEERPALDKQDCADIKAFAGVVSGRRNAELGFTHARSHKTEEAGGERRETLMEFKLDHRDLARVETGAEREIARLEELERPRSEPHRERLIEGRHPLASTLLRRAMIEDTLDGAKSTRYKHAARHILECSSLAPSIRDFGAFETHEVFAARLRAKHGRKAGFWGRVTELSGGRR